MLNNLGAAGAPPNTGATLSGADRSSAPGADAPINPKVVDCEKGPPSGPLSDCEKEEVCAKCDELNQKAKAGKLSKPAPSQYAKSRKAGNRAAKSLVEKAQRNPQAGRGLIGFHAATPACQDEHVQREFKGTSADHVQDISLGGHPTSSANLKWMSSRANSWMGAVMAQYKPAQHDGVVGNCC